MTKDDAKTARLGALDVFAGCTKQELRLLSRNLMEHRATAGDVLIVEGHVGQQFFVLVEGRVIVSVEGLEVAGLGPGDLVGEMAMLDGAARSATVVAATDLVVLVGSRHEFTACLADAPSLVQQLLAGFSHRLRNANELLATGNGGASG